MAALKIGVDIGGTRTKSGLVDIVTGNVLRTIVQPTERTDAGIFLEQVGMIIRQFRQEAVEGGHTVAGIGIGVPGFTGEQGMVLTTYGFLSFMENYPLKAIVERKFSLPCRIDNDARVVALGEAMYGKGKGYNRVLTLTLGTGVGFGWVVNGRFTDALPLSHMGGNMAISMDGGECYCGKTGCLEALVAASGIIKLAEKSGFAGEGVTVERIFTAALQKDAAALQVVDKVVNYLHVAIHNYVNLFAPDMVVLGGGIAKGLTPWLEEIKGRSYLSPYPGYTFQLAVSALQETAGMLGSAALFNR